MAGALAVPAETADDPMFTALVVEAKPARPAPSLKRRRGAVRSSRIELVVHDVTLRAPPDIGEADLTRMIRAIRAAAQ